VVCRPEARPYGVELASSTASSSESKGCTVRTGPKTSSWTTRESFDRPAMTVGLVVVAAVQVQALTAADDAAALLAGQFDVLLDLLQVPLPRHRADDGLGLPGVADRYAGDGVGEDADHGVVERARDEQAWAAHAELAGVEDEGLDDRADGLLDVGVREDDVRRVAAELHGDRLQALAGDARRVPADRGRPGEGDLVDAGVAQQRLAR
jgi:hypothetical protein